MPSTVCLCMHISSLYNTLEIKSFIKLAYQKHVKDKQTFVCSLNFEYGKKQLNRQFELLCIV